MEKHFVNYNQALALKELGFNESCLGVYAEGTKQLIINNTIRNWNDQLKNGNTTSAPLKSQVFEWAREKHKFEGWAVPCYTSKERFYSFIIENGEESEIDGSYDDEPVGDFDTYEEAESACIDELIKIVKG
jgi:hypothetical protein